MKKAVVSLFLALWLCCLSALLVAEVEPVKWNNAADHSRWTQWMLFGNPSYTYSKPIEIKQRIEQLDDALLLCIDQFNGYYKDRLARLSFIRGVPEDISVIDFSAGNHKEETSHRAYTHRGWNHVYFKPEMEKSHPDIRKQILISVVDYAFQFKNYVSPDQAKKLSDAMSCLLYNIHIIEDRYHSKSYYGAVSTLLLTDASPHSETVTHDLLECLPILFPDQKREKDTHYIELVFGIQRISNSILSEQKRENTNDAYLLIDRKYSVELKNLLADHLPSLLLKQPWFVKVFPLKWQSN